MTNQGLWGALLQYWCIEDKPRLHRRNNYFDECGPSHSELVIGLYVSVAVTVLFMVIMMIGAIF